MNRQTLKVEILRLRSEGNTYDQIKAALNCSKSTIAYHCSEVQKLKNIERMRKRRQDKLLTKFETFKYEPRGVNNKFTHFKEKGSGEYNFTLKDVHALIAVVSSCYLCGWAIDYEAPSSFHFDHKIPVSQGGLNTLDNLGIACNTCNSAKGDMLPEEFIEFCGRIAEFNK